MSVKLDEYWHPGWEGAKENFKPGLIVQSLILLLVLGYYMVPFFHDWLVSVTNWRNETGIISAFILGGCGAGLTSELLKWLTSHENKWRRHSWKYYVFNFIYWGLNGMVVDLFYKGQSLVFGDGRDVMTLLLKALADQFIFTLLFMHIFNCLAVSWRDSGFKSQIFLDELRDQYFKKRYAPAYVSNFCFWFPTVLIIYCMPYPLQMPTGALAGIFWVLILNFVVNRRDLKP